MAYPVGDIVLLSMLVRLMIGPGVRNVAIGSIGVSLLIFLAGDTTWAVINEIGWEPTPGVSTLLPTAFLLRQTFSTGVATWSPDETSDELIARADRALYQAKQAGRDPTVLAA